VSICFRAERGPSREGIGTGVVQNQRGHSFFLCASIRATILLAGSGGTRLRLVLYT